ncbi:hypothetical protein ACXITP_06620 [Actinotignum sanguinis]|uniref:hypothetical protein n=3 Tax=Actinotignum sanguinis TaxID=1445614 RepID=UPI00237E56B7|nr:hypothetical protein [Actinotignum sanguinis]MDE1553810.1 hypothetical protein [Actinotignum sanguinis]MDE1565616.1 hypothetical protein [Actinotignum sanguinis]MDE1642676.1 hypothetical protein [Actinotignum sanguinis]MDK8286807.1 hypothetical protein [Actinotignum sanguinis]MDK8353654.1 hypothetical protein [Actinotignum sanguinis]
MRIITPRYQATLQAPVTGAILVQASISYNGLPVAIWSDEEGYARFFERNENFPRVFVSEDAVAIFVLHNMDGTVRIASTPVDLPVSVPYVQCLPNGTFLAVGARCRWSSDRREATHNAYIYTAGGELVRSGVLGDGIQDVQALSDGTIWTIYFDEGIFGNFGWDFGVRGEKSGEAENLALGFCGLCRWNSELQAEWLYPDWHYVEPEFGKDLARLTFIADCYAMNCTDERTIICPYSDFPLVTIEKDRITRIVDTRKEIPRLRGLAVSGHRVLAYGDYREPICALADTSNGYHEITRYQVQHTADAKLPYYPAGSRGSAIHFIDSLRRWFVLDVDEVWSEV